jgi:hypothetical protein
MTARRLSALALLTLAVALPAAGRDDKPADGFTPLFNGRDLTGWVNVNCHPSTFFVKDGEIVTTGKPTGFLRTAKQYENFELEMDWMHVNKKDVGNSGLFVWGDPLPAVGTGYTRGIEVQVLVNLEYRDKKSNAVTASSHGDLFSIWGATCVPDRPHPTGAARCLPSENRAKGGGEWNHYKVIANDGVIKLHVNGKEVSGVSKCNPRKGYLALESEDAECHFKNIKIKELPSTNPKPEECAKVAEGHVSLFNGLDLKGWTDTTARPDFAWTAGGGKLVSKVGCGPLKSDRKATRGELVYDWKAADKLGMVTGSVGPLAFGVAADGEVSYAWDDATAERPVFGKANNVKPKDWNRTVVTFDGETVGIAVNGREAVRGKVVAPKPADSVSLMGRYGNVEVMNVFFREIKEK